MLLTCLIRSSLRFLAFLTTGLVIAFVLSLGVVSMPSVAIATDVDLESLLDDDFDDDYDEEEVAVIADPLEPMNRLFFNFNDSMYNWVVKPTTNVYSAVLADEIRSCISDAFYNILAPIRVVNHVLQGEFKASGSELSRFVINTTLGAGGLGDPALEEFGIPRRDADFGQTLGKYGVGDGFYLCWPVIGPSSGRDSVGLVGDYFLNPLLYGLKGKRETAIGLYVLKYGNEASINGGQYEQIMNDAFDPYVSLRNIYVQYRRGIINNRSQASKVSKKPDPFNPETDCDSLLEIEMFTNKIKANHFTQCMGLTGKSVQLLRYTDGGKIYYATEIPIRN